MERMVVNARVSSHGILHLHLPIGQAEAEQEVQVTVEPVPTTLPGKQRILSACDLLQSGLVGIWAERGVIGDSREFARRLRERVQARRPRP